jgi:hypothetical protein
MPKFRDVASWQQANLLMQPAFIRVVDNIRKQLEQSDWQGTYADVLLFPPDTSDVDQFKVKQLQTELETTTPERSAEIEQALAQLPTGIPGYHLHLAHEQTEITVDIWDLCYQVCFHNFMEPETADGVVDVDTSLFDETGDLDWNRLDEKTRTIVENLFAKLPG